MVLNGDDIWVLGDSAPRDPMFSRMRGGEPLGWSSTIMEESFEKLLDVFDKHNLTPEESARIDLGPSWIERRYGNYVVFNRKGISVVVSFFGYCASCRDKFADVYGDGTAREAVQNLRRRMRGE